MGTVVTTRVMTAAEYLAWERQQAGKHEYHRGEVFAMAGGGLRHNFLSTAVGAELRAALRDPIYDGVFELDAG
jgi:Uma2 family endonuclease